MFYHVFASPDDERVSYERILLTENLDEAKSEAFRCSMDNVYVISYLGDSSDEAWELGKEIMRIV